MDGLSVELNIKMSVDNSRRLMELSESVIPGGVNSPVRAFGAVGGTPRFVKRAEGAYLYDVDDNRYLDFCLSWGPLILGHADPDVVTAITEQARRGTTFGACTELEYELAEFIVSRINSVEKIRFVSSGTEAVMSAIRLARGFTERDLILKFDGCYHGHSDHLLAQAGSGLATLLATLSSPSSAGVPESVTSQTAILSLDDETALDDFFARHGDKLAAVVIEGIPANNGLLIQRQEYMTHLRELTAKHGALLILDEVISGFRIGMGGAAEHYGITPDLITYGKIVGGGLPVGALGGRAEIMDKLSPLGPVYQAGTLSGNPLAMTAGLTTLKKLDDPTVYKELEARTKELVEVLKQGLPDAQVAQVGSIFWMSFQEDVARKSSDIKKSSIDFFNRKHSAILDCGIYLPPSGYEVCFVSTAHSAEELKMAADTICQIMNSADQ